MRQRPLPHASPSRQQHQRQAQRQRRQPASALDSGHHVTRSLSPKVHEGQMGAMSSWEISSTTVESEDGRYAHPESSALGDRRRPLHESTLALGRGDSQQRRIDQHRADELQTVSMSDTENDPRNLYYPRRLYYQNGEVHFRKAGSRRRTRPEDFHTVYRTPLHVPDRKFKDFLLGRKGPDEQAKAAPLLTEESVTRSCFGFSLVAIVFLLWVGMLFDRQPLYIRGSLPVLVAPSSAKGGRLVSRHLIPDAADPRLLPARVSYRAAFAYALTAALCWYRLNRGWVHDRIKKRRSRYEDIPDHFTRLAADDANADDAVSRTLPMFDRGVPSTTAYQIGAWSRVKAVVFQWIAIRGWFYRPAQKFRRKREPKCV